MLTAGGKGEEALDGGPKGHSVFAGRFIEILESAADFITANELQASIREKVHSDASARNHTQTPGYGALYGLGDFVFIPKQQDRLGDLTGTSASRQKELEQLRKVEEDAMAAKKREQAEIAKKEKELAALDKQIAEMKSRLGTSKAQSNDNLDKILALAEQKEEQGKRLETLRQQREAEEQKRQQEIARLKQKAREKLAAQVNIDLVKYEKVASSKYAGDLKESAWKAMVAKYPDARQVKAGDIDRFIAALGLTSHDVQRSKEQRSKEQQVAAERERRIAGELGIGTYTDPSTGLMWAKQDNDKNINWVDAKTYCENYRGGGYKDWRMPTQPELAVLYASGAHSNKIAITGWVWASENGESEAAYFSFVVGTWRWDRHYLDYNLRALPVRSVK